MPQLSQRVRWVVATIAMAAALAALGIGWARARRAEDPLSRAKSAYDRGDWAAAADLARRRLKADRDDPDAPRLLARASIRLGRDDAAMSFYGRVLQTDLQSEDLCLIGLLLTRAGKRASGLKVWEDARSLDPGHAETLFELTRAYLAADRLDDAARAATDLAGRLGWESRAEALLGAIRLEQNKPSDAAAAWLHALERPRPTLRAEGVPSPIVPRKDVARALLRAGRPDEAGEQLRIVLARSPDNEASWLLSRVDLQRKDWAAARADLGRAGSFRDDRPMQPEPAAYVGTSRCAGCHTDEFRAQQASRHARTFFRASELGGLGLPASPLPDPADPAVVHTLHRDPDGRVHHQTSVSGKVLDAVDQYAFGSGDRGLTLVGRDHDGRAYELRLSDYPEANGQESGARRAARWDRTSGHPFVPKRPEEYLGQPLSESQVRRCLLCHVTDPRAILEGSGACASDRSIGCERCHGPAGNHLLAVEGKLVELDPAIARPALAYGSRRLKLCAECHSPPGQEVRREDPTAARFQGTTLTWSRCYSESEDALDCITCHDPHRDATPSPAHYEARCLECHSHESDKTTARRLASERRRSRAPIIRNSATRSTCPVNPTTGCIGCHMPAVTGVVPHSTFTDHFIRVHRD